jgi:hypothetical protein
MRGTLPRHLTTLWASTTRYLTFRRLKTYPVCQTPHVVYSVFVYNAGIWKYGLRYFASSVISRHGKQACPPGPLRQTLLRAKRTAMITYFKSNISQRDTSRQPSTTPNAFCIPMTNIICVPGRRNKVSCIYCDSRLLSRVKYCKIQRNS